MFDFADPDLVTGKRAVTNVPAQALLLMNSPQVMDAAEQTASRVLEDQLQSDNEIIEAVYRRVLSREPSEEEVSRTVAYLESARKTKTTDKDKRRHAALAELIHVLFASSEFRIVR